MKPPIMNILAAISLAAMPAHAVIYSGSLTSGAGLTGTGFWANNAEISWLVENVGETILNDETVMLWNYSYTLTVEGKDISHTIIEVSDAFTDLNILGGVSTNPESHLDSFALGNYTLTDQGASNPGMPDPIRGIKVDVSGDTKTLTWSFNSNIAPVWGDFYAKDGKEDSGTVEVYVYNTGFTPGDVDPTTPVDPLAEGWVPVTDHILVPDSVSTPPDDPGPPVIIPEPGTAVLGAIGLMLIFRRRKN